MHVDSCDCGLFVLSEMAADVRIVLSGPRGIFLLKRRNLTRAKSYFTTCFQDTSVHSDGIWTVQKQNRLKNLSHDTIEFYSAKSHCFFSFLGDTDQTIDAITEERVEDYIFYLYREVADLLHRFRGELLLRLAQQGFGPLLVSLYGKSSADGFGSALSVCILPA